MPLTTVSQGLLNTDAQYTGFKNRLINGDMTISQRNGTASVTANDGTYGVDRWACIATANGKFNMQQNAGSVTPPAGFSYYLGCTSTATTSLGATDFYHVRQKIEGFNSADLMWGTANAQTVILSFWVRSSLTGTFGGSVNNSAFSRSYPFSYTISSANTWEQKLVTVTGDTTGTWIGATNGVGIQLSFSLGSGSTYSGTAGSWSSSTFTSSTGATSVVGTNGATWYVTGCQLEKGTVATSFDVLPYSTELALCLRYYWRLNTTGSNSPFASGNAENTTRGYINLTLPQPMRTQPSCSISSVSHLALRGVGTDVACTSGNFSASTSSAMATIIGGEFNTGSATGASAGGCVKMSWNNASAWIDASAEL
jgi:hypothetical protein